MKETIRRGRRTGPAIPKPTTAKREQPPVAKAEPTAFGVSTSPIEVTFWITVLAFCAWRGNFYWKVFFVSLSLARVSYLAASYGWAWLPPGCTTFPDAILWLLWSFALCTFGTSSVYFSFLTWVQLFWSPMDLWTKPNPHPQPLSAFDVLFDPGIFTRVELIAIHGLGSNPETAWKYQTSSSTSAVQWLKDLLPKEKKLKGMKIIQVNHQTRWNANVAEISFESHAHSVLQDIESAHGNSGRPIIFVAHSFGGLLLEKALLMAKDQSSPIASDVRGILFLGVPHGGTKAALWGSLLACTAHWRGSSTTLLKYMDENASPIAELEESFHNAFVLRRKNTIQHLPYICDFFEQLPEKAGRFVFGPTVNRKSGNSRHGYVVKLESDHRGLNKYGSATDPNYLRIVEQLGNAFEYALKTFSLIDNAEPTDNVPFPKDHHFVRRKFDGSDIIETMHTRLFSAAHHKRIALVGLGGMGKSQLAIEFAYLVRDRYPDIWVFWIRAGNRTKFESSYCDIALKIGLISSTNTEKRGDVPNLVLAWLKNNYNGRWLIILDGVDDVALFSPPSPTLDELSLSSLLPQVDHGMVLITSRIRTAALKVVAAPDEFDNIIKIEGMNDDEAQELLRTRIPGEHYEQTVAERLVRELENIPLAIAQAAACINYNLSQSIVDYLDRFLMGRIQMQSVKDPRREEDSSDAVFLTWRISFEEIKRLRPSASDLLSYMSVLDHQCIPRYLLLQENVESLQNSAESEDPVTQKYNQNDNDGDKQIEGVPSDDWLSSSSKLQDPLLLSTNWQLLIDDSFNSDVSLLLDFGMITAEKGGFTFTMHRLVQDAVIDWLSEQSDGLLEKYRERAISEISMAFPVTGFKDISGASDIYKHAERVLQYPCKDRIPLLHRAEILYRVAIYREMTGSLISALKHIKESLDIRKGLFFSYNLCVTETLFRYGTLLMESNMEGDGENVLREALSGFSMSMGFSSDLKWSIRYNLAVSLMCQGKIEEAKLEVEAVAKRKDFASRRLEAELVRILERYNEAADMYRNIIESIAATEKVEHTDIREMVICKLGLAICLNHLKEVDLQLKVVSEAFEYSLANLGIRNPLTIDLLLALASSHYTKNDVAKAEEMYLHAVNAAHLNYEQGHPIISWSLRVTCDFLIAQSRWEDLVHLIEEIGLEERTASASSLRKNWNFWTSWIHFAYALYKLGRIGEANEVCVRLSPKLKQIYGSQSIESATVCMRNATCLAEPAHVTTAQSIVKSIRWWNEVDDADFNYVKEELKEMEDNLRILQRGRDEIMGNGREEKAGT